MKKIIKSFIFLIILIVVYIAGTLILGTITDYKPAEVETVSSLEDKFYISDTNVYSALIWNIGYAGLGANMDFFYDGGKHVRDTKENTERNLVNIGAFLEQNDSIDFILLQEVGIKSKRSFKINEMEMLNAILPTHFSFSALNYKVNYIPMPLLRPMGKVKAGLTSYSKSPPTKTTRYSFPGNYSWPTSIFMLDRCFLVQRFPLDNHKELIIVNTHSSAYDNGTLRKQQQGFLKSFLLEEEKKGNYILVGGDWNQSPPNLKNHFPGHVFDTVSNLKLPEGYPTKDWHFSFDNTTPSNRRVMTPYKKGTSPVTLIDFFLSSPNIEVLSVKGIDMDFKYSDHQPVTIQFKLEN